jgi:hypothetical protein
VVHGKPSWAGHGHSGRAVVICAAAAPLSGPASACGGPRPP